MCGCEGLVGDVPIATHTLYLATRMTGGSERWW